MKIYNIGYTIPIGNKQQTTFRKNSGDGVSLPNKIKYNSYSNICFQGLYEIKPTKKIHIDLEKSKLIKHIETLLNTQSQNLDIDTYILKILNHTLSVEKRQQEIIRQIYMMADQINNNKMMSSSQKYQEIRVLEKELKKIKNMGNNTFPVSKPNKDEDKYDYKLLNIFKTAALNENYNFAKIFKEYYSELNNINTIEDLKKKYPKLNIPERPENIIAQELVSTVDRDFYLKLDELFKDNNYTEFDKNINTKIYEFLEFYSRKYNVSSDFLYDKIAMPFGELIIKNHVKAIKKVFIFFPINHKKLLIQ